jgi:hypothetical protein
VALFLNGGLFSLTATLLEAVPAIYRTVVTRFKRNFSRTAALGANCRIHLALPTLALVSVTAKTAALFAGGAAYRTTDRFVLESFFGIEFLLAGGKHEIGTTISTF